MPILQLPLMNGTGKDYRNADYIDYLPANLLATPKEVLNAAGYLRSFPGIAKRSDVSGISRGAQYNTAQNAVYRVLGGSLYRGGSVVGSVPGSGRVPMAHSRTSQAVIANSQVMEYRYDGTVKTITNWPESEVIQPAEDRLIKEWVSTSGDSGNTFTTPDDMAKGSIVITVTPKTSTGATGDVMTIAQTAWGLSRSQAVSSTKPYITGLVVTGNKDPNSTISIEYTLNIPTGVTGTNASEFEVRFKVPEIVEEYTQYELGSARDIVRARGRYVWAKDGTDSFFISDLQDESRPDRYSGEYRAESQPDGIIGMGVWHDFVVCFGTSTTEYFSLTGATTAGAALYVANPAYMVMKGIAGTHCKCSFLDGFAIISNPATGAPSIYFVDSGQAKPLGTASIDKILRDYTADELATGVLESLRFDAHELLIVHLPRHVLIYDAAASQSGPQWCVLKTGLADAVYRAIDFIYEGNQITCGDKVSPVTGQLQFDISSQYDEKQEHLLFTPLFKADNARVFDFELEASTGVAQIADNLFLSATTDGINYGREQLIPWNAPFVYDRRVIWKRIGRIRKNVGFKVRIITKAPVTLSGCQVRIE